MVLWADWLHLTASARWYLLFNHFIHSFSFFFFFFVLFCFVFFKAVCCSLVICQKLLFDFAWYKQILLKNYLKGRNFTGTNFGKFPEFWSISQKLKIKVRLFSDAFNFYHKLFIPLISLTNLKFSSSNQKATLITSKLD